MNEVREINIEDIIIPSRARLNREADRDLMYRIKKFGLIEPIVVTPAAASSGEYFLVHGLNRLLAFAEMSKGYIPAVIHEDIDTTDIKLYESICNNNKRYTIWEKISLGKYIESKQKFFVTSEFDELLGLNPGEYLILKEIEEFGGDVADELLSKLDKGEINFTSAKRKLDKARKELLAEETDEGKALESAGNLDKLDSLPEPTKQSKGNRKPLPASLRKEIEFRDEFTCQSCGLGGETYLRIFEVHHIIPVYLAGLDEKGNLILLCPNCHKMVHFFAFGDLYIDEKNADKFKTIIRLGNIIKNKIQVSGKPIELIRKLHEEYTNAEYEEDGDCEESEETEDSN